MTNHAKRLWLLLCLLCLLPLGARAQDADPAVWGVYARLLGASLETNLLDAKPLVKARGRKWRYTWSWDVDKTAIIEARDDGMRQRITSLGGGRLATHVNGQQRGTGTVQADGAVLWKSEGSLYSLMAPLSRVRLEGDAVVMDFVSMSDGKIVKADEWERLTGKLPQQAQAAATAASAPAAVAAAASSPVVVALAESPAEEAAGPRNLSDADMARLRASMARDKLQRAETLRRQQEEARRAEEARREQAEFDAQMAAQRAQQEREERAEARRSDDAFASALMGGLNTFKNEMANAQAQRAQQQAFLANLQRQQQQAEQARQREQDRQRQAAAAQEQLARQRAAAAAAAQQQAALAQPQRPAPVAGQGAGTGTGSSGLRSPQPPAVPAANAYDPEKALRENAAADRLRRQQLQDYQLAQQKAQERAAQAAQNTALKPSSPAAPAPGSQTVAANSPSSCRTDRVTSMVLGRNKTEESTRADIIAMAAGRCQGKGQLGAISCSSTRDISIDGQGRSHDLGTRTYECTAVVDCGTTREVCYGAPGTGSAQ